MIAVTRFQSSDVEAVFAAYPADLRASVMALRGLIFEVAGATDGVGRIEETLKWGQPSYLTPETKSGTTIRIDKDNTHGGDYALYVNCKSSLVADWRERYPALNFGGDRSVHFSAGDALPEEEMRHCIAMALSYHKRKRMKARKALSDEGYRPQLIK